MTTFRTVIFSRTVLAFIALGLAATSALAASPRNDGRVMFLDGGPAAACTAPYAPQDSVADTKMFVVPAKAGEQRTKTLAPDLKAEEDGFAAETPPAATFADDISR